MTTIDLNADLGEGYGRWTLGDDDAMLAAVTSANVACGFHAGDPLTMTAVVDAAHRRGVAVGAHVSYRDLAGFGRRFVDASEAELVGDVVYQIGALTGVAASVGATVRYVKPHGALYSVIAGDDERGRRHAHAVVEAVTRVDPGLVLVGLAGSPLLTRATEAGLSTIAEAFADRAYTPDGRLVPRTNPGAVLHDPAEIVDRVLRLVETGRIRAVDGTDLALHAESVCVHGDTPGAVAIAAGLRTALEAAGVDVRSFVAVPRQVAATESAVPPAVQTAALPLPLQPSADSAAGSPS
ncbi:LamB/YcsF family protein [Frigoribacterium faeni]|uniref:LamB/YcsF family protein n=1 Tax=Frigoribacterium faeni TaxID=145483 RepID=UPI001FAD464F|nr:5-oxoprolinase subunit PxpA [Frigoribacterium faeni]MCJ0702085.1 LamB/YcsF family protein [Frigoribacterium faeni]